MHHSSNDIDEFDEEYKSKTEMKHEMHQFHDFAQKLVDFTKHQRSKLPLNDELLSAMALADKIKNKHEALRRHVRYVGKLLSTMDLEPINKALDLMANKHQQETIKFNKLELLRDDLLINGHDAVESLIAKHPSIDRQKLRQLVRNASKEKLAEKPGKSYRDLFQYLKPFVNS